MKKPGREKISVIIPVYNEEKRINTVISHVKSLKSPVTVEIIVIDGSSSGNTINTIQDNNAITAITERGRARQMNSGAALATGNILLFLHADTTLPEDAMRIIQESMESGKYVGGAFTLSFDNDRFAFRLISWMAGNRYRRTRIPFGDQGIFILKDYFSESGGYKDIPLMEDAELMRRIKKAGDAIYISDSMVITSTRKWESDGVFYTNMRNWTIQFLYLLGTPPEKLVKYYYGNIHKPAE